MANTLANLYAAGNSSTNSDSVTTTSRSFTAANLVAFPVRWNQGSGGTTRTLSTVTSSVSGDNAAIQIVAGSDRESTTGVWQQWVVCTAISSTASRTFTATLSGQAAAVEIPFMIELAGIAAASVVGAADVAGNAFGDPQSVDLVGCVANSTILAMNSANDGSGSVGGGATAITMPATPFSANSDVPRASYLLDAGAAGDKTVSWTGTTGVWSISAIEIKTAAGAGGTAARAMNQLTQQGIA